LRARCQQQTPKTTIEPTVRPASMVWPKAPECPVAREELPDTRQLSLAVHELVADRVRNSWTRPVATPIAKLIRNRVPKKWVSRSHDSFFVRCHSVWNVATIGPSPSYSGTNRKW
jgi:hypothetical protein